MVIDDFSRADLTSRRGTRWRAVSDRVMGGISDARIRHDTIDGRGCLHLSGDVRLENSGGFIQAALDLDPAGATLDASSFSGIRLVACGNAERYGLHLRTPDNVRPWQSYRAAFTAGRGWKTLHLPFDEFMPHRIDTPLDRSRLRRIGLVAIGRAFRAEVAVAEVALYRGDQLSRQSAKFSTDA